MCTAWYSSFQQQCRHGDPCVVCFDLQLFDQVSVKSHFMSNKDLSLRSPPYKPYLPFSSTNIILMNAGKFLVKALAVSV